jgi:hypothetical protein
VIYIGDDEDTEINEDALMDAALEAGASDVLSEEVGCFEVYTEPADLESVRDALTGAGFPIQSAELEKVPSSYTALTDEEDIPDFQLPFEGGQQEVRQATLDDIIKQLKGLSAEGKRGAIAALKDLLDNRNSNKNESLNKNKLVEAMMKSFILKLSFDGKVIKKKFFLVE